MPKRIVVLNVDGSERELSAPPGLIEMQGIVGGYVEHVRVLDHVAPEGHFIYTSMFVNEESLLNDLPRNAKATEWYQRNVRTAFPEAKNPFRAADEANRRRFPNATHFDITPPGALAAGYKDDPWIAGPAVLFEGWTVEEVDDAVSSL